MTADGQDRLIDSEIAEARAALEDARAAVVEVDAEIQKKENEIKTATGIAERDISNLEREAQEADDYEEGRSIGSAISRQRSQHIDRLNELESQLGDLRGRRIESGAGQTVAEVRLSDLEERAEKQLQRQSISQEQVARAAELEARLDRIEAERADLVKQIDQYAPVVEAQREAASVLGSAELSEAYATQADAYRGEWRRWLLFLGVAVAVALVGGVGVILLTHPSGDASNGEIVSRIAIEILVLGLLVYAVRVTAHQFRVHRHLETVAKGKAAALMTFSRLVAGPGEVEVRAAVAVALAQAVFDSSSTGFMDSSQDGVTIIERIAAPVAQRLAN